MGINLRVKLDDILKEREMTQTQLRDLILEKTGKAVRAAAVSELYNNQRKTLNKELIEHIINVLELNEPNDLFEFEES